MTACEMQHVSVMVVENLKSIQRISSLGNTLSQQEEIDDGEECMQAYIEDMPEIFRLVNEILSSFGIPLDTEPRSP